MSRLQVAFTLHSLSTDDEKNYGLHVEFDLARSPLTDTVMLRIEGKHLVYSMNLRYVAYGEEVTYFRGTQQIVSVNYLFVRPLIPS